MFLCWTWKISIHGEFTIFTIDGPTRFQFEIIENIKTSIIFTLLYSLTIEQFLMQLYLGCTLVSNLIHSLMLSNMFSAGGGAIYDAPKARGGAIFDAHKPRGGAIFVASKPWGGAIFVASKPRGDAIFVAYHWNVLVKNAKFHKKIFYLHFREHP